MTTSESFRQSISYATSRPTSTHDNPDRTHVSLRRSTYMGREGTVGARPAPLATPNDGV